MGKSIATMMGGVEKTEQVDFGFGESMEVAFDPTLITFDINTYFEGEPDEDAVAEMICTIVKRWELVGPVPFTAIGNAAVGSVVADGKPIPLEPKIVRQLPVPMLHGIMRGITQAALPK